MEDLNKRIVKHAYSKGDVGWGQLTKVFSNQLMRIGGTWKEIGRHRFEDDSLYLCSRSFATVVRSEKCDLGTANKFIQWIVTTMVLWGHTFDDAITIVTGPEIVYEMVDGLLRLIVVDANAQQKRDYMKGRFPEESTLENSLLAENAIAMTNVMYSCSTLEVVLKETGERIVLMAYGNVDVGKLECSTCTINMKEFLE